MDHSLPLSHLADDPTRQRYDIFLYLLLCAALAYDSWRLLGQIASGPVRDAITLDRLTQIAGWVLLSIAGWSAWRRGGVSPRFAFLIGIIAGATYFSCIYGLVLLDPTRIDWVLRGDWAAHYGGWAMYRQAPWTWPPGATPTLMYPVGTSVVYSDSLPLLAMALKPFGDWLPESFQYVGIWLGVCCLLQGAFGALLMQRRSRSVAIVLTGAILFLYAPVFLQRTNHITLMSQWLLLAGLWLYFRPERCDTLVSEAWPWWVLAAIAALDMPYLAMMLFTIHFAYWFRRVYIDRARSLAQAAVASGTAIALTLMLWLLSGAFIVHYRDEAGGIAYGVYSFNLLGFFNAAGTSRILPAMPIGPGQYEGYAYLGLGILALIAVLAVGALLGRQRPHGLRRHWPLAAMALLTTAYAASTVLMLGPWKLLDFPLTTPLLATFRSSGRFIWVAYYLIVLATIWWTLARWRFAIAATVLVATLAVQSWDASLSHVYHAQLRTGVGWPKPEHPFADPRWDDLARGRHHLTLIPTAACGVQPGTSYIPFLLLAAKHAMTLNTAYVARWDPRASQSYCENLVADLARGKHSTDNLYVVGDDWWQRFAQGSQKPECAMLDGLRACVFTATPRNKE